MYDDDPYVHWVDSDNDGYYDYYAREIQTGPTYGHWEYNNGQVWTMEPPSSWPELYPDRPGLGLDGMSNADQPYAERPMIDPMATPMDGLTDWGIF